MLHHIASDPLRLGMLRYLVTMGARFNVKNDYGDTCGLIAARARCWATVEFLTSTGASITLCDVQGRAIYHYAQLMGGSPSLFAGLEALEKRRFASAASAAAASAAGVDASDERSSAADESAERKAADRSEVRLQQIARAGREAQQAGLAVAEVLSQAVGHEVDDDAEFTDPVSAYEPEPALEPSAAVCDDERDEATVAEATEDSEAPAPDHDAYAYDTSGLF